MKSLFFIGLLVMQFSCQKVQPNDTVVTFSVNGSTKSLSGAHGNYCEESYFTGFPASYSFILQSSGQRFEFATGANFAPYEFVATDGSQLDSLVVGKTYSEFFGGLNQGLTIDNQVFRSISIWRLYVTITSVSPYAIAGTFNGMIVGVDSASGAIITDSLSDGIFRDIPVFRHFQ